LSERTDYGDYNCDWAGIAFHNASARKPLAAGYPCLFSPAIGGDWSDVIVALVLIAIFAPLIAL
jgi:hypothetical protein